VATNSHFLAFWEDARAGRINGGDRVLFGVSGSGQTVGTALYVCDDLPDRLRHNAPTNGVHVNGKNGVHGPRPTRLWRCTRRVRIAAAASADPAAAAADSVALLRDAGEACLREWNRPRGEVDLVIHTGVYRSEFLSEPALAAIAAGELGINHDEESSGPQRTFAFDLMNGSAGTLTGCLVAGQLLDAGRYQRALVLASEVENNAEVWPENRLGLREGAGALVLEASDGPDGFSAFAVRWFPEHLGAFESHTGAHDGQPALHHSSAPDLDDRIRACVRTAAEEFLRAVGMKPSDLTLLVLPHRSRALADELGVSAERVVLPEDDGDPTTTGLARTFADLRRDGRLAPGTVALVIEVAAGMQVACALYHG
jgi:3-oxoacyl-[acyl-carrier-protein] synthase III